ncbi:hypothetical protein LTS18_001718, partial [Coniosporium uncinatum]
MAGLFPGILLGVLLALLILFLLKRRRQKRKKDRDSIFGHVGATISDPIYHPQYSNRTDFAAMGHQRDGSSTTNNTANTKTTMTKNSTTPPVNMGMALGSPGMTIPNSTYQPPQRILPTSPSNYNDTPT